MAGFGSIQKELKKNKKEKGKGKTQQSSQFSFMKKNPFFKKREKVRPQKQLKD